MGGGREGACDGAAGVGPGQRAPVVAQLQHHAQGRGRNADAPHTDDVAVAQAREEGGLAHEVLHHLGGQFHAEEELDRYRPALERALVHASGSTHWGRANQEQCAFV